MSLDQRPGLLIAVAGKNPHKHGAVELRRHRQRVLPAELSGIHQSGEDVSLYADALVPVQLPEKITAAGVGVLADQQQTAELYVPGVVKEKSESPLDQLLQAVDPDPLIDGRIVPLVKGQGALPEIVLRLLVEKLDRKSVV